MWYFIWLLGTLMASFFAVIIATVIERQENGANSKSE